MEAVYRGYAIMAAEECRRKWESTNMELKLIRKSQERKNKPPSIAVTAAK